MKTRHLIPVLLLIIFALLAGCGGGTSKSSEPAGVNKGVPSIVQLLPVRYMAQTNSQILFFAKVLDGNGNPVEGEPVTFTNISPIGTITAPLTENAVQTAAFSRTVHTNSIGLASLGVTSTVDGFVTMQAEVFIGSGVVRDTDVIYFTSTSFWPLPGFPIPVAVTPTPLLSLEADGDDDGIFDEPDDFIVLQDEDDTIVRVRATVSESFGGSVSLVPDSLVTFGADVPWRNGSDTTCSDGGSTCEVVYLFGNTAITDALGQASVFLEVAPTVLRDIQTLFNVTAMADNGGADLMSLFVEPVVVTTVTVSANPNTIEAGEDTNVTAFAGTSAGTPVPDGTSGSFTASEGGIEPFATTTDGIAEVTYSSTDVVGGKIITATFNGVSGTTTIGVTAPPPPPPDPPDALIIVPPETSIATNAVPNTVQLTISGGSGSYQATSDNVAIACNDVSGNGACGDPTDSAIWTTASITVTITPGILADTSVNITASDSDGAQDTSTINIFYIP